jgi:hypothetical protein
MAERGKASRRKTGTSANASIVAIAAILAFTILIIAWIYRPQPVKPLGQVPCPDGSYRSLIDAGKFDTQYWAYSIKLEASLSEKEKLSAALEPQVLHQLSEAVQQGNEFRKWLVYSYNACAIPQREYDDYGAGFQGLDNVARNLQESIEKGVHTAADRAGIAALAKTYVQLAQALRRSPSRTSP